MKRFERTKLTYALLAITLLIGLINSYQAQAAWTKSENSRVKALEKRIQTLEQQLASQQVVTLRYLATTGAGGTYEDICPGSENLDPSQSSAYLGRLSPKTDELGNVVTDLLGQPIQRYVYACKVSFIAMKN